MRSARLSSAQIVALDRLKAMNAHLYAVTVETGITQSPDNPRFAKATLKALMDRGLLSGYVDFVMCQARVKITKPGVNAINDRMNLG